jgi:uncharacterized oligopeptide transporter (OPT) family protein
MPAAIQWQGVAELIARGIGNLPISALISMVVAAICAATIEITNIAFRGRLPISSVSVGLGVVLPPEYTLPMWVGAMLFWWTGRRYASPGSRGHAYWKEGCESICAGLISGSALVGIGNAIVDVVFF